MKFVMFICLHPAQVKLKRLNSQDNFSPLNGTVFYQNMLIRMLKLCKHTDRIEALNQSPDLTIKPTSARIFKIVDPTLNKQDFLHLHGP